MAGEPCHRCGTPRIGDEQFCPVCDTFFGWHDEDGDDDATSVGARPPVAQGGAPAPPPYQPAGPPPRKVDRVRPPVVTTETTEVVVSPTAPGTFPLLVRNGSTIVEAYAIDVVDAPPWLTVTHGDANLLPDESRGVAVTLAVRAGTLAVAQRLPARVRVRSGVDPDRTAEVALTIVVPPAGPPATLATQPSLVRLQDTDRGRFAVRLDNRGANHPRTYALAASDPEGVVRVEFVPATVETSAGGVGDAVATLTAPPPDPGQEASRQVTISATDDHGTVTTQVTVTQATTAPPERRPVKLRLEPSQVSVVDHTQARVDVVVDNRAGHEDVVVHLRGRDPAGALGFAPDHDGFTVQQGRAVRLGMTISAALAPPGTTVSRPFTVVADASGLETEIDGTLDLTSRATAITTAGLRLVPEHLVTTSGRGSFRAEVDNRRGAQPLHVRLTGSDEFGRASLRFDPPELVVPPGQVAVAGIVVAHPKPEGGTTESRRIRVSAGSGNDAVHAEAVFTQRAQSYATWWAYLVAILGVLLVGLGTLVQLGELGLDRAEGVVRSLVEEIDAGAVPVADLIRAGVVVLAVALLLLCLVFMLFGLVGTTGRGVRVGAVLAALAAGAGLVAGMSALGLSLVGFGLALAGAAVAFAGGVMIRHVRS